MNIEDFQDLKKSSQTYTKIAQAIDSSFKTLLYGHTSERYTHHVYQKDGLIHLYVYAGAPNTMCIDFKVGRELLCSNLIPDKRLYPERCDYNFCKELLRAGFTLPFTIFDVKLSEAILKGEVYENRLVYGQIMKDTKND